MAHIPMNPNRKLTNNDSSKGSLMDVVLFPLLVVVLAIGMLAVIQNLI